MELKKNPKKDLNRNSGLYFILGLALVMLLTYVALEWKTYDHVNEYDLSLNVEDELLEEVPITEHLKTLPPPKPPVTPPVIEVVPDEEDIVETVIESTETNQEEPVSIDSLIVDELEEDIPVTFIVVEDKPVFPGCETESDKMACFQKMMIKHVNKNIRYPEIAQEMGIEGKVYMSFIIQKDGSIGDVKIARSPDKNLGSEALRIINKLPKMTPGKQRGKAVRVPFSIPITFKLQ